MSALWRVTKPSLTALSIVAGQVLHAAHRPDIPELTNQDPSGTFGRPGSPSLRIVVLGDSSVTAPGVVPLDAAWPRRIALDLAEDYRVELISFGEGGAKARDMLNNQIEPAMAMGADLALVSVGANDALRGTPVRRFEGEIVEALAALTTVTHGVGLSGVGDMGTLPRLPTLARGIGRVRGRAIDMALARAAARFPSVVKSNAWGPAWAYFDNADPEEAFTADLFHASAIGHGVFADGMRPVVDVLVTRLEEQRQRSSD